MATRRLYRSKNGEIMGVCKGIAEWRDYPVDTIRLIFILVAIFTAIAPCLIIYFALGLILPVNPYEEGDGSRSYKEGYRDGRKEARKEKRGKTYYYTPEPEDYVSSEAKAESDEEYERRKKESDWDNRFSNS
ncbi:MAG: PspC domain-containing protein [Spirochaetales bacterium]|nr:PspC domain-containing protein [Spirochaetales bacterium]